jgi:transposase
MSDPELLAKPKTELSPKSKVEGARRLDGVSGAGHRRAFSAEEKDRIVAESYAGVESISAVARRHGVRPQQVFAWRHAARPPAREDAGDPAFTPVIVDVGTRFSDAARRIEVVIGAATVRVPAGIDAASLTAVLRAVKDVT